MGVCVLEQADRLQQVSGTWHGVPSAASLSCSPCGNYTLPLITACLLGGAQVSRALDLENSSVLFKTERDSKVV